MREQNVDHKHDGTLAKKFERQMQVQQQPQPLASIKNNGDRKYFLNTNIKIRQGLNHKILVLHTTKAFVIMIFVNILCRWCSKHEKG